MTMDVDLSLAYHLTSSRYRREPTYGEIHDALHEAASKVFADFGLEMKDFTLSMQVGR